MILALLTCFTSARESHHISHPAPESAPASSPDYAPLSGGISNGNLKSSPSNYQKKIVASNTCGGGGGASGGYPGQSSGYGRSGVPVMPGAWGGRMGGSTGSDGGMQYSAAGSGSSVVGIVAFSVMLLAGGLVFIYL